MYYFPPRFRSLVKYFVKPFQTELAVTSLRSQPVKMKVAAIDMSLKSSGTFPLCTPTCIYFSLVGMSWNIYWYSKHFFLVQLLQGMSLYGPLVFSEPKACLVAAPSRPWLTPEGATWPPGHGGIARFLRDVRHVMHRDVRHVLHHDVRHVLHRDVILLGSPGMQCCTAGILPPPALCQYCYVLTLCIYCAYLLLGPSAGVYSIVSNSLY